MGEPWFLYCFHFHKRWKHARHYTGITKDPVRREAEHIRGQKGQGSPLIKQFIEAGIGYDFQVVKIFDNFSLAKAEEKQRKKNGAASKWCPKCKEERRA